MNLDNSKLPPDGNDSYRTQMGNEENIHETSPLASAVIARLGSGKNLLSDETRTSKSQIVAALSDSRWSVRAAAIQALGRLGEQAPVEPLVKALHDPAWRVRTAAARALGQMGQRAPIEPLVAVLGDEDESVRAAIAQALGNLGERAPIDALLIALNDKDWLVREASALALGKLGKRTPVEPLMKALKDQDESVREAARFALQQTHPEFLAEATPGLTSREQSKEADQTGRYELRERLGSTTWKAFDVRSHRDVALKLLPDLPTDPNFRRHLEQDMQKILSLHHPNIVQMNDFQFSQSLESRVLTNYIVMKYIDAQNLADYISSTSHIKKFPTATDIVYLFACVGSAIDYAHQKDIIHGNVKPTNILLDKNASSPYQIGEPSLTDFSFPRLPGYSYSSSSFNPFYLSPEQIAGKPVDQSTDIYSLGVILYEICTGIQPFRGGNPVTVMHQQINAIVTAPEHINPYVSPTLSKVILRSLAKDPAQRFPSASSMATALAQAFNVPVPKLSDKK